MEELTTVGRFAIWALPVLFAITLHEVAHGWVAKLLGDRTAEQQGRLSLNPLKHIDPVGTVLVPGLLIVFSPFVFGWARPVPVDWGRLRHPRRDVGWVAVAGPAANLIMTGVWILISRLAHIIGTYEISHPLILMAAAGMYINLVLMLINLVPILPLDGGRVLGSLLSPRLAMKYQVIEPYGMIIMLLLIFTNILSMVLSGPLSFLLSFSLQLGEIPVGLLYKVLGHAG